jgi:hypothetical protein
MLSFPIVIKYNCSLPKENKNKKKVRFAIDEKPFYNKYKIKYPFIVFIK